MRMEPLIVMIVDKHSLLELKLTFDHRFSNNMMIFEFTVF